jgi:hypothetical protein
MIAKQSLSVSVQMLEIGHGLVVAPAHAHTKM